jgi:ATP phosphoribosyltransferase regulatory subunit
MMTNWILPEYVEDVLPGEARRVETLRRRLLDLFVAHGYELVMPPMFEYLESLLTGTGRDLDLKTFKLVDQLSGRMIGLRADITPQVARIDAHLLNRPGVTRLTYCGTVLHAQPSGMSRTREVLQLGAEIYGHAGVESDIEIQGLMLDALAAAGVKGVHLDLGHVGLFRAICRRAAFRRELEAELFQALQGKDVPLLRELTRGLPAETRDALLSLTELFGGVEVIAEARRRLAHWPEVEPCLAQLDAIAAALAPRVGALLVDLAELRGYHYHSGIVFAAYASGSANVVVQGGRYDEVGQAFGRARPATGFSLDLRELAALAPAGDPPVPVRAPYAPHDAGLAAEIARLRGIGEIVIADLPGAAVSETDGASDGIRILTRVNDRWQIVTATGREVGTSLDTEHR